MKEDRFQSAVRTWFVLAVALSLAFWTAIIYLIVQVAQAL